jgi:hypothetical protein
MLNEYIRLATVGVFSFYLGMILTGWFFLRR